MDHAVVAVPAAPVRRKPNHRKEMVNQLLFGETVKVLKGKGDLWVKVRSLHDNYEGWMTNTMLLEVDEDFANTRAHVATASLLNVVMIGDKEFHIPVGSSLPFLKESKGKLGMTEFTYTGHYYNLNGQIASAEHVKGLTASWLNAPYLWGGRTPLGVDCSGFVQVVYKLMGIDLPRDTWQQSQEGKPVKRFSETLPGDLIFFDNREEIVHVGILLEEDKIIHASGKVRIDTIDKKGIINADTGKRTLSSKAIRRLF
ncbi:MAG TPA: C40 family peptidase [Chitinophagaceae bacterium]|nr:C40 family peptidase [Chitinophagaceae bacterium]